MNKYESLDILKNSKSVCIIAHLEPDPDAIASLVVLRNFLKDFYKIKTVDIFAEASNLTNSLKEILQKTSLNCKPKQYETAIMLDSPNIERLGIYKQLFVGANTKVVIDHHATNERCGDINIVEICSSTCEIIYSILKEFGYKISTVDQGKLYAGIITDTNNFSVGEVGERTFKIVCEIVPNINRDNIYKTFLANKTLKNLQLEAIAINNIKSYNNNQIIISHISQEELNTLNAKHTDLHGIVNHLATINNANLICLIEPRAETYYVSMRAKNGYDVSNIAKINGGGGHVGAAAFNIKSDLYSIEKLVLKHFQQQLKVVKPTKYELF